MNTNLFGSFSLASIFLATTLIGFDAQVATACSGGSSSSQGISHGSSLGSGSVTVCVGSGSTSPGTSTTQTITKTVTVQVPAKTQSTPKKAAQPAPKPKEVVAKSAPKPVVPVAAVSCPSAAQLASMPRSADAAERWAQSLCSPAPAAKSVSKPAPKPTKAATKTKTTTITETITIELPGSSSSSADAVTFYPNPLLASVFPDKVLSIGQSAVFSSNPSAHYGVANVLGRQAQVHFVPVERGWTFSDGKEGVGADFTKSFSSAGKYQAVAYVNYLVSYRLLGESNWQPVSGSLLVESNTLEVMVGASNLKGDQASQGALLVGEGCRPGEESFGC